VILPSERVGPYLRALEASLEALAPNDDYVPLSEAVAHVRALAPGVGGELLAPAEISARTGMPAYAWLERAQAEQVLARRSRDSDDPTDDELARAASLDADLGARLRDRRDLHRHLRRHDLLPALRTTGAVRRLDPHDVALCYDRMAPDGRWVRIRGEVRVRERRAGPLRIGSEGRLHLDERLQHFLTRHFTDRLDALHAQLAEVCEGEVRRLSRAWLGPFWFPGVQLPDDVPAALGTGLLLHASAEVMSTDIEASRHLDPWRPPPPDEQVPEGLQVFRERRFAATGRVVAVARAWAEGKGFRNVVVPVHGGARRRL